MNTVENQLGTMLSRTWWVLMLRGVIAIVFGVLTWRQPEISVALLILFFGAYILADGVLGIYSAVSGRNEHNDWWVLLIWALISVGVGILTLLAPGVTALALLFYIAIWAIATGVVQIVAGIRLRNEIKGEWLLILGGLASVVFGTFLMAQPVAGALTMAWLIAAYAVLFGVVLVILAFRVRTYGKHLSR